MNDDKRALEIARECFKTISPADEQVIEYARRIGQECAKGEPVAWRLVRNNGTVVGWADIERGDTYDWPKGNDNPGTWCTARGKKEAADILHPDDAPHTWQPLGVIYASPQPS